MNKELAITSQQYGFLSGIFFFGYFLFEVPSNLLLHKVGARIWFPRIAISWGGVAALTGFVHTTHQLFLVRFLLGLAEAGYVPGVYLYVTYWFPERERARAIALFNMASPVASLLGGPVSGLILDHVHWMGVSSWRWLLVLEGLPAISLGLVTYLVLPSRPREAKFLSSDEKKAIEAELGREEGQKLIVREYSVLRALASPRVWHVISTYVGVTLGGYTLTLWGPQVLKSLSNTSSNSFVGFLTAIPSLLGLQFNIQTVRQQRHPQRKGPSRRPSRVVASRLAGQVVRKYYFLRCEPTNARPPIARIKPTANGVSVASRWPEGTWVASMSITGKARDSKGSSAAQNAHCSPRRSANMATRTSTADKLPMASAPASKCLPGRVFMSGWVDRIE